jgi:phosphopantothenoylcysteine decarboxylase
MRRNIILGLTGSVASVLYHKLVDELDNIGLVNVVLTEKSKVFLDSKKLNPTVKHNVYTDADEWTWKNKTQWEKNDPVLHIDLSQSASALIIAPCSANTLAKIANGLCDNLLTTIARAWDYKKPFIICPAMNTNMWKHRITNEHLDKLKSWGAHIVYPQSKMLACNTIGIGALQNIYEIKRFSKMLMNHHYNSQWEFPIKNCSGIPIGDHPGAFGTQRKFERHTGVDLYTNENEPVFSVEYGEVVGMGPFTGTKTNSTWWNDTDYILVEGNSGVVCYGEIKISPHIQLGNVVRVGDQLGNVVRVLKDGKERSDIIGHSTSMLHVELYPNDTKCPSNGFEDFLRNPTDFLLKSYGRPDLELI